MANVQCYTGREYFPFSYPHLVHSVHAKCTLKIWKYHVYSDSLNMCNSHVAIVGVGKKSRRKRSCSCASLHALRSFPKKKYTTLKKKGGSQFLARIPSARFRSVIHAIQEEYHCLNHSSTAEEVSHKMSTQHVCISQNTKKLLKMSFVDSNRLSAHRSK